MPAIKLSGGGSVLLKNVKIDGFDIGVQSHDGGVIRSEDVIFNNVRQPYDVHGGEAHIERNKVLNDPLVRLSEQKFAQSGWRRNGPPLPSQCPHCKTVFPSRNYNFGTSKFYSRDNEETCRECGRDGAKVADGLFDLTAEAVKIIHGPDISYALLAALGEVAEKLQSGSITDNEAVEQFALISPAIGEIARRISSSGANGIAYLSLFIALITLVYSHIQTAASLEQRDLAREQTEIARQALDLQRESHSTDDLLKEILQKMSDLKIVSPERLQSQSELSGEKLSAGSTQAKPPAETGSIDFRLESKPKRRRVSRQSGSGHRYNLHCCCRPNYPRR